jgi:hypothetical protein
MRTVHETEALRPSDPVPKHHSSNPLNKVQRIRLVIKDGADGKGSSRQLLSADPAPGSPTAVAMTPADIEYESSHATFTRVVDEAAPFSGGGGGGGGGDWAVHLPADVVFDADELQLPPQQLYALLRRQMEWAGRDAEGLRVEAEFLERDRRAEWVAKELVLEDMLGRAAAQDGPERPAGAAADEKADEEGEARVKLEDAMDLDVEKEGEAVDKRKGKAKSKRESGGAKKGGETAPKLGELSPFPYQKDTEMTDAVNGGEAKVDL